MPRESFDLVVLGDELAGLIAATLCARRGMRVLLAQIAPRPASYALGALRLPVEPLLLAGVGGAAVRRVLDELHFQHPVKRKLRTGSPALQLVGPDTRLDLDADDALLARELARERADQPTARQLERAAALSGELDRLLEAGPMLPPQGFWEKRELGRVAGALVADAARWDAEHGDEIGAAFARLPGALSGGAPADPLAPLAAARALDQFRRGAPRLIGDLETLREMLLDKFASHSGEVRVVEPAAIATSWGKVTGLRLAGGEEIGAGHLVAAAPIAALEPWLDGKPARRAAELASAIAPAAYRYTLHLVVDAIGVPEGMGSLVFAVADPSEPLTSGNAFVLHAAPPDEQASVVVSVQALLAPPAAGEAGLEAAMASLRARLRERLEIVMPFVDEHVRVAHSPNQAAPAEGLAIELAPIAPPRPLWRPAPDAALGLAALDFTLGVKHLTLASNQILPALGVEGDFLVGWSAAKLACEGAGKKKDYLQGEVLST